MRFLITGATSMIGLALGKELLEQGHQLVMVARRMAEELELFTHTPNATIVFCDMCDYGRVADLVTGEIDTAVLLAWNGTRGEARNDRELQERNIQYNRAILDQLLRLGCRKIITAGSQAEYGPWTSIEKIKETDTPYPNTMYGIAKLRFYEECCDFANKHSISVIEPRFFSLYGPNDYPGTLIMSVLKKMLGNQPCELTACIQMWDYLYIDDAIKGLVALSDRDSASGVYNFGYGESAELKQYIETMYRLSNSHSTLNYGVVPYPKTGIVNVNPDVRKLKSLGWEPQVSFEQGIMRVIERLQKDN